GSLAVDVATAVDVMLTDRQVTLIPTDASGPLYRETSVIGGLLLGRSSAGVKGLIVLPGVTDADFTGEIKIMAYTLCAPLYIPKGSKTAQIEALFNSQPNSERPRGIGNRIRNKGSFGSTGPAVLFTQKMTSRPIQKVTLSISCDKDIRCEIYPLLDTGADVTIIS
ncbi:POK9 protein, partial [Todus mexicanus]|nr:POK9 protein [Todus mexicanus]